MYLSKGDTYFPFYPIRFLCHGYYGAVKRIDLSGKDDLMGLSQSIYDSFGYQSINMTYEIEFGTFMSCLKGSF